MDFPGLSTTLPVQKWSPVPSWPNTAPTRAFDSVGGGVRETPGWRCSGRAPSIRLAVHSSGWDAAGDGEAEAATFSSGELPLEQPEAMAITARTMTATAGRRRMAGF
ncbi:hypothetical protein GCM10010319_26420 [Streptomyces blastmyceticus]|uniref:Uncharacterized protein n=1 Tax=Streptomyces blastmyceticus TaxID=68180 RepID=A0ABP3GL14_9ACTN